MDLRFLFIVAAKVATGAWLTVEGLSPPVLEHALLIKEKDRAINNKQFFIIIFVSGE